MEAQCCLGIGAEKQREITLHGFIICISVAVTVKGEMSPRCKFSANVVLTSKQQKQVSCLFLFLILSGLKKLFTINAALFSGWSKFSYEASWVLEISL